MSTLSNIKDVAGLTSGSDFAAQLDEICLSNTEPLAKRRVHEIEGVSALGFAFALTGNVQGLSFWIARDGKARSLRARGLQAFFDPAHLTCVQTANRSENLWAAEEALRCRGAGLVILQIDTGPNLFESRRLQIAAQAGGTIGLVIIGRRAQSSAAQTRWQCTSSVDPDQDWQWELTKNKQGRLGKWTVRGDPDPTLTTPPDLLPQTLSARSQDDPFPLTSLPVSLASPASARPMAPA